MHLFTRPYYLIVVAFIVCPFVCFSQADRNVWNSVQQAPRQAGKTIQKTGSKIKKFKNHLQQWGLDSNYNHGFGLGARLNSTGWTGLLYYQRRINKTQSHFYQLSLSEIKHEKQVKQQRQNTAFPDLGGTSPFIFGKVNNVYALQLGHGREFLLLPGVLDGNLSVSIRAQAGFSLAMLKPYYLKLIYVEHNPDEHAYIVEESYSNANIDKFLNPGYINGASKWKEGLSDITYIPGAYADIAVAIEPIKNKSFIKTVTLGANFSMHSKKLVIMADQHAYPWSGCAYVGLNLGKRWK